MEEGDTHSRLLSLPTSTVAGKRCAGEGLRPRSVEPTRSAVFTYGSASSVSAAGVTSRLAKLFLRDKDVEGAWEED
jgi:hypothetical protein